MVAYVVLATVAPAAAAHAQEVQLEDFPMPTDRDFTIDVYQGAALGSGEIVGMGGTAIATAKGSAGMSANPASPGVRSETSTKLRDWDWHIDWISKNIGSDFDNNGIETEEKFQGLPAFTIGAVFNYGQFGLGASVLYSSNEVPIEGQAADAITSTLTARLALGCALWDDRLTVGAGIVAGTFDIARQPEDQAIGGQQLFSLSGAALETGAIWRPHWTDIRVGVTGQLPVTGKAVEIEDACDPLDCEGYVVPERASVPWRVGAGFAWRYGETRWNRPVYKRWRDERYVTLAADVLVTGTTEDGYGIEAYSQGRLQPSGRDVSVSVRGGVEYEWVPGWFRIRGGSYYEPARYQDGMGDDVAGRVHFTLGLDVRIFSFQIWGKRYRVRISLTSDGAEGYANGGVSIGFWH